MFKVTLGALLGAIVAAALPKRSQRLVWIGALFVLFVIIEVIFIANGGDKV